jgi:hypothetical protein
LTRRANASGSKAVVTAQASTSPAARAPNDPKGTALRDTGGAAFPALEENGVAYDRQADARYEYHGEAFSFRPGLGTVTHFATQTGAPSIPGALLEPIRPQFREADAPEKVRAALQALEEGMGPDVPPLLPAAFTN